MQKRIPYTLVMIDPASDIQVHHWARDMQVEPYQLRAAVRLVGQRLVTFESTSESPRPLYRWKTGGEGVGGRSRPTGSRVRVSDFRKPPNFSVVGAGRYGSARA